MTRRCLVSWPMPPSRPPVEAARVTGTVVNVTPGARTFDHWFSASQGPDKPTYTASYVSPTSQAHEPLCSICHTTARPVRSSVSAPMGMNSDEDHDPVLERAKRLRASGRSVVVRPRSERVAELQRPSPHHGLAAVHAVRRSSQRSSPTGSKPGTRREVMCRSTTSFEPATTRVRLRTAAMSGCCSRQATTVRSVTGSWEVISSRIESLDLVIESICDSGRMVRVSESVLSAAITDPSTRIPARRGGSPSVQ